jgi:nicotinate-nucleotide adenylyltransferase
MQTKTSFNSARFPRSGAGGAVSGGNAAAGRRGRAGGYPRLPARGYRPVPRRASPAGQRAPRGQPLLAHLNIGASQWGAPRFSLHFRVLSCYASPARGQGGVRRAAKRLAKGASRHDRGAFRGVVRPAPCGHVHVSREALKRLGLDRVWWLVSPGNPLKDRGPAPLERRMAAARALVSHPRVIVTDIEARLGTRYTGETIEALRTRYPGVRFVWLMGADNLAQFHRWQRWDWIMRTVPICVLARPGHRISARTAKAAQVFERARMSSDHARRLPYADAPAWVFLNVPMVDVSSTEIRARGDWSS